MADVSIQALRNGPLLVKGPMQIVDAQGQEIPVTPGQPVALCRCGQSGKKPLCDGSHKKANFQG